MLAIQLILIPFTAGVAYGQLLPIVVLALVVRGLLSDMQEPILNGQVMAVVEPGKRATAATANQTVWLFGLMLGSGASGLLQEMGGWTAAFSLTMLSSVLLSALFAHRAASERRRRLLG